MNKVSRRVMIEDDLGEYVSFRATCACGGAEHKLVVECWDEGIDSEVNVTITTDVHYIADAQANKIWRIHHPIRAWVSDRWLEIKGGLKLIFTGQLILSDSFHFQDREHVETYIAALQDSLAKVESYHAKYIQKLEEDRKQRKSQGSTETLDSILPVGSNRSTEGPKEGPTVN